jgi:hypothetical protein
MPITSLIGSEIGRYKSHRFYNLLSALKLFPKTIEINLENCLTINNKTIDFMVTKPKSSSEVEDKFETLEWFLCACLVKFSNKLIQI